MRWGHIRSEIGANKTQWFGVSSGPSFEKLPNGKVPTREGYVEGRSARSVLRCIYAQQFTFSLGKIAYGARAGREGPVGFRKSKARSAVTFSLEKFSYSGGRSEFGLRHPVAAGVSGKL